MELRRTRAVSRGPAVQSACRTAPFASTGAGRLSRLSVWWLNLGIQLERIEPGKPQQTGGSSAAT